MGQAGGQAGAGGGGSNHSASARYAALAAAGLAAAAAAAETHLTVTTTAAAAGPPTTASSTTTTVNGFGAPGGGGEASVPHPAPPNQLGVPPGVENTFSETITAAAAGGNPDVRCPDPEGSTEGVGLGAGAGRATATPPGSATPTPGQSLRAGSDAAAELGIGLYGSGKTVNDRERPYLLAYDKRYDTLPHGGGGGSKWSSSTDLTGLHDTAVAAAADGNGNGAGNSGHGSSHHRHRPCPPPVVAPSGLPPQLLGWAPPHLVPPTCASAGAEGSVHRKMLALMALESAAAAAAAAAGAGEAAAAGAGAGATADDAPFSVTEYVRAATAAAAAVPPNRASEDGGGGGGGGGGSLPPGPPSALMLMRSMNLALQQQQQQQGVLPPPTSAPPQPLPGSGVPASASAAASAAASARAAARATAAAAAMKTVPENNRMSMDLGARPVGGPTPTPPPAAAAPAAVRAGGSSGAGSVHSAPTSAPTSVGRRQADKARRAGEGEAAAAAARMADATRQVGSLVYMAPELVTSGNYNEKVDVFSFAIIAFELFNGKLLAMKIATEYACQVEAERGSGAAAARGARAGPGGLPAGCTRSAEKEAEDGVMSYVMRRCRGAREALPSWWPEELRGLIARCWAQDPADRPSFTQIHRELRRLHATGALADMDGRDPLRSTGCGCSIC
ncbi:hypothetical protein PLESTM_001924700 [Pleodorina starrii]|nr:hypothetical protein PLESTM_001924700 [Pleodorina starrii]